MKTGRPKLRLSLSMKLILSVGLTFLLCILTWSFFNIRYLKTKMMTNIMAETDRLGNTIRLGTHYAMMLNSRDDINQIINNIARQKGIETIRIYNKEGQIKFSSRPEEVDRYTNIKAEACDVCHRSDPPSIRLCLEDKTRIVTNEKGFRLLGTISPIYSEAGCAGDCHFHPKDKKVLGALDLLVSLKETDQEILQFEKGIILMASILFLATSGLIFAIVLKFVSRPIQRVIKETEAIAKGEYGTMKVPEQEDEMSLLAGAINRMSSEIGEKQRALNQQVDEYQKLFDDVPCMISIQDRRYRIIRYNRKFAEQFDAKIHEQCYRVYKGLDEKCPNCPVEKTFADGLPHTTEESGTNRDGSVVYWMVLTSAMRDSDGRIIAAMEMSLDITHRKHLEEKLAQSRKKYQDIFDNIPNPVFVLDAGDMLILDCNGSAVSTYEHEKKDLLGRSFLTLFPEDEKAAYREKIGRDKVIDKARQLTLSGKRLYVNIRISPSNNLGREVLLVTTSDITKRLEAEQQLLQAAKMATLGEMATGVAHELNQPLSFMKTASSFFLDKIRKQEKIEEKILSTMLEKIDSNVDRASRIITHMRNFARKSDVCLEKIQVNEIIEKVLEIFSRQLTVRDIEVIWEPEKDLPMIMGDGGPLEQVFINLLVNARDAIEEGTPREERKIFLSTKKSGDEVVVTVRDTGCGIDPAAAEKIFEPFYTTKEVGKGTGLGLSISYGIVKECGGDIRLVRGKGGASFELGFPVCDEDDSETAFHAV